VRLVKPAAASVWELLWSRCRWKQGTYDVKITVKSISRILGIAESTVSSAINSLIAEKLLEKKAGKLKHSTKTYTVLWYTPEKAALTFNSDAKKNHRKSVIHEAPKFEVFTPKTNTEFR
jgi:DNA-binding MarR family transcriptional regulator